MEALQKLIPVQLEFAHITTLFTDGIGMLDSEWVPKIAADGRWIVITSDRGRRGSKQGGKLPRLCVEFKITHVLLSSALHGEKTEIKQKAILQKWTQISALNKVPPGSRFKLRYRTVKGTRDIKKLCFERCEVDK